MNYYPRHLGDYAKDTRSLTMLEHGAYTLLLDHYYATEAGIPKARAYKIAGARSREERAAVDLVLEDFFDLGDDGIYRQGRAERAIQEFHADQAEAEADKVTKREHDRERQRRARQARRELFEQLRAAGVVPPWNTTTEQLRAMASQAGHAPVTGDNTAIPIANSQEPNKSLAPNTHPKPAEEPPPPPSMEQIAAQARAQATLAGLACRAMTSAGVARCNPSDPKLLEALSLGVTAESLANYARAAIAAGKTNPFAYAIAAATGDRRQQLNPTPAGDPHESTRPSRGGSAVERVQARILERHGAADRRAPIDSTATRPED